MEVVIIALLIFIPLWRICGRAGFHPAISLLSLLGPVGWLILLPILAFKKWPAKQTLEE